VSPRRQDPSNRAALVNAAARLIATGGPRSLSARRLTEATGTSAKAVYTYFGSMNGIVREIIRDGFERVKNVARGDGLATVLLAAQAPVRS
jgi:AcrR family transcriptional regulator